MRIYDCIDFGTRSRCAQVASDLAFLRMDLDLRDFPAFGQYLARRSMHAAEDSRMAKLLPFNKERPALVRASS